jgi:UDP-GlcNAc3NAcA epimerase
MIRVITIIGARPQIIKAAALSRVFREKYQGKVEEILVHTGQHYDENMSEVFIDELDLPIPQYNLNVGSGTHGQQTSAMITGIEEILLREKPHCILLYGDTNSTLAGAVAASKIHVPVVHIEAGLRSFNKKMPEELNRIIADHTSTLLFSPTKTGIRNLVREGFRKKTSPPYSDDNPCIFHSGDVMYDNTIFFSGRAEKRSTILKEKNLEAGKFILCTIHRDSNTDNPERLKTLFGAILKIAADFGTQFAIPLHPRTSKLLVNNLPPEMYNRLSTDPRIRLLKPASFFDMIMLEKNCSMIWTDSGGVQKEAYFHKKPCLILRSETEWVELVKAGVAVLTDADEKKILKAYRKMAKLKKAKFPPLFGDGKAAEYIANQIFRNFN